MHSEIRKRQWLIISQTEFSLSPKPKTKPIIKTKQNRNNNKHQSSVFSVRAFINQLMRMIETYQIELIDWLDNLDDDDKTITLWQLTLDSMLS